MSLPPSNVRRVELTAAQRRTVGELIGRGPAAVLGDEAVRRTRALIEDSLADVAFDRTIWLSKERLREHAACSGWLQAGLAREGGPFRHTPRTAAGTLVHRAIQLDVPTARGTDPLAQVEHAAGLLPEEESAFAEHWRGSDDLARTEAVDAAARSLSLFRDMFPPLPRRWQPVVEQSLRSTLCGGRLVLSGRVDLLMGRRSRLVIDFKSGQASQAHAQDMRFYGLLVALVFGSAPYRMATVFLESLEWQAEDVSEEVLAHAARGVVAAAREAVRSPEELPDLRGGPHCRFCPRSESCAQSAVRGEERIVAEVA